MIAHTGREHLHSDRGGTWPTAEQELLLAAALLPIDEALPAWQQSQREVDFEEDHLDLGSFRLLPLVYHNLRKTIADERLAGRLRGIHRRSWYENQMRFRKCASLLQTLHGAGVETLVLKGPALVLHYYHDHGARPMGDLDVMVPRHQVDGAVQALIAAGWTPALIAAEQLTTEYIRYTHAHTFLDKDRQPLDLHWRVIHQTLNRNLEENFWQNSIPLEVQGIQTRALAPTDQLLHTCVHGLAWKLDPAIRWVADAYTILKQASAQIDWSELAQRAAQGAVSISVYAALGYLRQKFNAPVPEAALAQLRANPVTAAERRYFDACTSRSITFGYLSWAWARYGLYLDTLDAPNALQRYWGFANYLRIIRGHTNWREFAWYLLSRGVVRTRRVLKQPVGRLLSR